MAEELSNEQMLASVQEETSAPAEGVSSEVPSEGQPPAAAEPSLYEYSAAGKTIKEPLDMILKRASMGYDYAQKMAAWNQKEKGWSQKEQEYQQNLEKLGRWKEYDDYARTNPEWARHVEEMWANKNQYSIAAVDPSNPVLQQFSGAVKTLEDRLKSFETKFSDVDNYIQQSRFSSEVSALDNEIKGVREAFKNVDFDQPDDQGKSLEIRVLEHMQEAKIPNFKAAFKDFYFDQLVSKEREQAKEAYAKELQKRQKSGLLSVSSTPASAKEDFSNGRAKGYSYDDLAAMAKKQLGVGN